MSSRPAVEIEETNLAAALVRVRQAIGSVANIDHREDRDGPPT